MGKMTTERITMAAVAPWFGSNRLLGKYVGEAMQGCRWVGLPFAGSLAEVPYMTATHIVANDLHRHVINLARVIAHPQLGLRLYRDLRRMVFHPDEFDGMQSDAKFLEDKIDPDRAPLYNAALAYFVSQWMGRSGKSGTNDEFNGRISTRWNANGSGSNTRYRSAVRSLVGLRRSLARCEFTTLDAFEFLGRVQDVARHGIYLDPPFPGTGEKYKHQFTEAKHGMLADALCRFEATRVVCRFYDHPLIRFLYPEDRWRWKSLPGRNQVNDVAPEVLLRLRNASETSNMLF